LRLKNNSKITVNMAKPQSFKKDDSRINRNGAPLKDWTMTALYRQALEEMDETGVPKNKIIARKLIKLAEKGDVIAIKELNNRIDGMPTQKNEVDTTGELTIKIVDYGINNISTAKTKNSSPKV